MGIPQRDASLLQMKPKNNIVYGDAALQTHGIWKETIGFDPHAPAAGEEDIQARRESEAQKAKELISLVSIATGQSNQQVKRGCCKKCGKSGHFTSQCMNILPNGINTALPISIPTPSPSPTPDPTPPPKHSRRPHQATFERGREHTQTSIPCPHTKTGEAIERKKEERTAGEILRKDETDRGRNEEGTKTEKKTETEGEIIILDITKENTDRQAVILGVDSTIAVLLSLGILLVLVLILAIVNYCIGPEKVPKIALVGLKDSGKTALFNRLQRGVFQTEGNSTQVTEETFVFHKDKIDFGSKKMKTVLDCPGDEAKRSQLYNHKYFADLNLIVFVIDSTTFESSIRDVARFIYFIITNAVVRKNKTHIIIAFSKIDALESFNGSFYALPKLRREYQEVDQAEKTKNAVDESKMSQKELKEHQKLQKKEEKDRKREEEEFKEKMEQRLKNHETMINMKVKLLELEQEIDDIGRAHMRHNPNDQDVAELFKTGFDFKKLKNKLILTEFSSKTNDIALLLRDIHKLLGDEN
ncbi:putative signal recognition particle receptor subunit beta [Blattamonas nauphoetae]|uniref:Signal recognition particle receptor subunit beta n=1 Tax=Blattamonas nauphoetae TaxID=2049346 RepID=A0ABQ9Y6E7_9EUKA|nr:putative signal recognition particle receptor subunit beta [Blattamonas nauphoetae]